MFDDPPDTIIVDMDGWVLPVPSEDLTMQVNVEGVWHRRFLRRFETACGIPYHSQRTATRQESLVGPLCRNCFTIRELAESDDLKEEAERDTK